MEPLPLIVVGPPLVVIRGADGASWEAVRLSDDTFGIRRDGRVLPAYYVSPLDCGEAFSHLSGCERAVLPPEMRPKKAKIGRPRKARVVSRAPRNAHRI